MILDFRFWILDFRLNLCASSFDLECAAVIGTGYGDQAKTNYI